MFTPHGGKILSGVGCICLVARRASSFSSSSGNHSPSPFFFPLRAKFVEQRSLPVLLQEGVFLPVHFPGGLFGHEGVGHARDGV